MFYVLLIVLNCLLQDPAIVPEGFDVPAGILIRSHPTGARVFVDGHPVGVTEIEYGVAPGSHTVLLERAGFQRLMRVVEVAAGQKVTLDALLVSDDTALRRHRFAKWSSVGVALASVAVGIALLAVGDSPNIESG